MNNTMLFQQIVPIVQATIIFYTIYILLTRYSRVKDKMELLLFLILSISVAAWGMKHYIQAYALNYRWFSALFVMSTATLFAVYITEKRYFKWIIPFLSLIAIVNFSFLLTNNYDNRTYRLIFIGTISPVLLFLNYIL